MPRRPRRIHRKDLKKAGITAVILVAAIAICAILISKWENIFFQTGGGESRVIIDPIIKEPKSVTIDGVEYLQTSRIQTYLLMGIDKDGKAVPVKDGEGGGQADMQILLIIDDEHETWRILQIDRDTMVESQMLDSNGNVVSTTSTQICLLHTTGTGMEDSCKNVVNGLSAFLWDQPIDGYIAMNMGGINTLNDAMGGIPVKVTTDFTAVDPTLPIGETVTLKGDQAELFVRSRMSVDDGTNVSRMARQREYMKSFVKKFATLDMETIVDVYDTIQDYIVTDMGSGLIEKLAEKVQNYEELELIQFEGVHDRSDINAKFYVDETNKQYVILDLFYSPVFN
ncbi:MAG: LCP family protein [Solobacterium sp.]|nr:LCP family protein [Solobacterium sp.]